MRPVTFTNLIIVTYFLFNITIEHPRQWKVLACIVLLFVTILHFMVSRPQNAVFLFFLLYLPSHISMLIYSVHELIAAIILLNFTLLIGCLHRGVCLNVYRLISDINKNVTLYSLCEIYLQGMSIMAKKLCKISMNAFVLHWSDLHFSYSCFCIICVIICSVKASLN
jgi:hypothetical protein